MIQVTDKHKCCGCTACQQICPKQCIEMKEDQEGFLYPAIDSKACIDCGNCESVCPVLHPFSPFTVMPKAFACKSKNTSLRMQSSSGGIFSILATEIINMGGIVVGASFLSDWSVGHTIAYSQEELGRFRGSKYVQSHLGNIFKTIREELKVNKPVLFSGTPCQVAGLRHFLKKNYDNLYTIDFVCHSIPSPKVWKMYLSQCAGGTEVNYISFRNKNDGWHNYGLLIKDCDNHVIESGDNTTNPYMRGFLDNLYVRPSCHACPARCYTSGSDIMLADCWGLEKYHPNLDDDKGMSQVLIVTEKGIMLWDKCSAKMDALHIPYAEVEDHALHLPITSSTPPNRYREYFFLHFEQQPLKELITYCLKKSDSHARMVNYWKGIGRLIALDKLYRIWKKVRK